MESVQKQENQTSGHEHALENSAEITSSGGMSMPPPPFGLTASPVVQRRGIMDAIGDALNIRENEADKDLQEDIDAFKSKTYGPITYTNSSIGGSGFQASYLPTANQLAVEIRGKVRFAPGLQDDGGTVSSPNTFMNQTQLVTVLNAYPDLKAQVLPYYQWGEDEKQIHLLRFQANVRTAMNMWNTAGHTFQVSDPGWEAVTATPNINVQMGEGNAVHTTENYGFLGMRTRTDEAGSDHLQIEIVKQITQADANAVNNLISTYFTNLANSVTETGVIGNLIRSNYLNQIPQAGDARAVRSYVTNDPGSRGSEAPEGFNNFMSLRSNGSDSPEDQVHKHTVYFNQGEATLRDSSAADLDAFLADPMVLLQNPNGGNVSVDLSGYTSSPGSHTDNEALAAQRLTAVADVLNAKMDSSSLNITRHVNPAAETNNADYGAEFDLATNTTAHSPSRWDRVDIEILHRGRGGQNTLAHELGHNLGLGDEYVGGSRTTGDPATHDGLAKGAGLAGGAAVGTDNTRMMEGGNDIQPAHFSTFADALNQLTSKTWNIV